jgi:hypothetical protein
METFIIFHSKLKRYQENNVGDQNVTVYIKDFDDVCRIKQILFIYLYIFNILFKLKFALIALCFNATNAYPLINVV